MASSAATNGGKARSVLYNFDGDDKVIFVDGTNYPAIYNTSGNSVYFSISLKQYSDKRHTTCSYI